MLDLRLNISSGDVQSLLNNRELVKICEELDSLHVTFEVQQGATEGSALVRTYDKEFVHITIVAGAVTMTSKSRGTYESKSSRGAINELHRIYGEDVRVKVAEEAKQSNFRPAKKVDLIVNFLQANGFDVKQDAFGDSVGEYEEETLWIHGTRRGIVVVACVDCHDYCVAVEHEEVYSELDYEPDYAHYVHQGRAVAFIRDHAYLKIK